MKNIIEIQNINKFFGEGENRVHILRDISISIEKGDFVSIIGQSGSGKSTLMNIIGCLDKATSGKYYIDGEEISGFSHDELSELRKKKFGFIFQRYHLLTSLNAQENVALPAIYAGVEYDERMKRAEKLLDKLELSTKLKNKPNQLSGGQQQRVSIARALMNGGEIILADEPTGALDSKSGIRVMEILNQLHEEGHTIILVTHDKGIANQANRVIEIKDGEIFNDTRLREIKKENQEDKKSVNDLKKNKFQVAKDQFFESFKMSVSAIVAHKMRSLLTMLGIIIGIASIVCVVAIGNGSQQKVLANISSLGTNTMDIFNGEGMGSRFANRIKSLSTTDVEILEKQSYVDSVTPNSSSSGTIVYQNQSYSGNLKGVGADYFDVRGVTISSGRAFTKEDETDLTSVALIDENTQKSLFGENEDPIGKVILFNKKPLKIIGTVELNNVIGMNSSELNVFAPYTVVMNKVSGEKYIGSITVKVKDDIDSQVAQKSITDLLKAKHGKKDFFIMNTDTLKKTIESTTGTMKILISSIAVISLVVGGIGVMNIMLVSITERTKEIGIRMAIGAKEKNILQQFLLEAVLICFIGGIVGIVLSLLIGWGFNSISTSFSMIFSSFSIVMAVLFSTLVGVVFGYMPAKNAAKLDPIEALSRE
ncbi:MAG: MacB family efflux pump subunit [Fusobacterium sp.]|uniref:MacB family efflux pump subunit n=1 Tax=Fusobacterium sp. TaxID=68766 RepID=UPI003F9F5E83